MNPGSSDHKERAASEVIAVVLLIGIVMIGITAVLLIGMPVVESEQRNAELQSVERSFTQLDSEAERVASGSTTGAGVDLGLRNYGGTLDIDPGEGAITVEYHNGSQTEYIIKDEPLGTMVYEDGDTTVAYQGGGVWRSDGDNSTMVSPPEMKFTENTLELPVTVIKNERSVHTDLQVSPDYSERKFPDDSDEMLSNRVSAGVITVTIESDYYQAWARYFDQQPNTFADTPEKGVARVMFFGSGMSVSPEAGIIATSGAGELRVAGSGSYIDSYDSSDGTYEETVSQDGVVMSHGPIEMRGGSEIRGDVNVEDTLDMGGESYIDGDVRAEEIVGESDDTEINGSRDGEPDVPTFQPLDAFIEERGDELRETNDNDRTDLISEANELNFSTDDGGKGQQEDIEGELRAGDYYFKNIVMEGHQHNETLIMNTSDGNITVFVEDHVVLDEGDIEVKGGGTVRLIMGSNEGADVSTPGLPELEDPHLWVNEYSNITVEGQESPRFQIIGPTNFRGGVRGPDHPYPTITAMIVAPTPVESEEVSEFHVRDANFFGAIVAGEVTAENNAEVHFDHATTAHSVPFDGEGLVEYLYVTERGIKIEES